MLLLMMVVMMTMLENIYNFILSYPAILRKVTPSTNYLSTILRQFIVLLCAINFLKDLIAELKSEISGNFSHTITSLCKSPAERDADELRKAMKVEHNLNFLAFVYV